MRTVRAPAPPRFVVTLETGESRQSQIWNSAQPMPVGRPFRWVLERTASGVRVRDLGGAKGATASAPQSLSETSAQTVELKAGFSLTLQPVRSVGPAFDEVSNEQGELRAYSCIGNWILQSQPVDASFVGRRHGERAFELVREGSSFKFRSLSAGVVLPVQGKDAYSAQELVGSEVRWGDLTWKFDLRTTSAIPDAKRDTLLQSEWKWFSRALSVSGALALLLIALSWVMPKPAPKEELIPEQFAKIVIPPKPAQSAPSAPAGSEAPATSQAPVPKSVQKAEVVQAFRAQQLQNAVSGLLKGGMTNLLAQSDFVTGAANTANAKRMFNSKSQAVAATAEQTGLTAGKNVKVAAIGGEGGGAGGGTGVGYGKGQRAGVTGQGKSFVSMDTPGAAVDEGLTKDEVGEVIHRHLSEVRYCYESAMIRTPDIEGKLMVAFVIGSGGAVRTADVQQSTLPDPRLDDCIIRRLMTWKFPQPRGGVDVKVSYPFLFKTLGR